VLNNREIAVYHELPLNGTAKVIYHILMEALPDPVAIRPPPPPPPPPPEPEPEPVILPPPEPVYRVVREPPTSVVATEPTIRTGLPGLPTITYIRTGINPAVDAFGNPLENNNITTEPPTAAIPPIEKTCPEDFMEVARPRPTVDKVEEKPKKASKRSPRSRKKK